MNCVKCGKEIKDNAVFCVHCGSRQDLSSAKADTVSNHNETVAVQTKKLTEKKPLDKQHLRILGAAGAAAVLLAGVFIAYNRPAAKMNRAIKADDLELAWEIYDENLYGEELSDKSVELLKAAAERIKESHTGAVISYEDACTAISYIEYFDNEAADEIAAETYDAVNTQHTISTYLDTAEEYRQNEDYYGAMSIYSNVLSMDPENASATQGLEDATNEYREHILKTVREYAAQDEFDLAEKEIQRALEDHFQDDETLSKELASIQEQRLSRMSEDIYTAAESGDWDGAVELLDTYQKQFPDEQKLTDIRADIEEKMPITLKNLTMVSSKRVEIEKGVVTDRYGNVYDGAVSFDTYYESYALYNLSKKFTSFTGKAFVQKNDSTGYDMSFAIYVDEKLVYYKEHISEETAPINFNIDLTNGTTLRIATDREGYSWNSYLMFADTSFAKVGDAANAASGESTAAPEQAPAPAE